MGEGETVFLTTTPLTNIKTAYLPEYKLWHGQVGTVVEILAGGKASEVEFCDREGHTYESVGLRTDQIMVLHYDPVEANLKSA